MCAWIAKGWSAPCPAVTSAIPKTAKILGERAMSFAFDDLPRTDGPVTPAAAMGDALIDRLAMARITFERVEEPHLRPDPPDRP